MRNKSKIKTAAAILSSENELSNKPPFLSGFDFQTANKSKIKTDHPTTQNLTAIYNSLHQEMQQPSAKTMFNTSVFGRGGEGFGEDAGDVDG